LALGAGAVILLALAAFCTRPQSLDDGVAFIVGRICDQLGVQHHFLPRWGDNTKP
jgi:flavin prenyltransferase